MPCNSSRIYTRAPEGYCFHVLLLHVGCVTIVRNEIVTLRDHYLQYSIGECFFMCIYKRASQGFFFKMREQGHLCQGNKGCWIILRNQGISVL